MLTTIFITVLVASVRGMEVQDDDQLFRITPNTEDEVDTLRELLKGNGDAIDAWNFPTVPNARVDVHVKSKFVPDAEKILIGESIKFTKEDLNNLLDKDEIVNNEEKSKFTYSPEAFDYRGYNSYGDIVKELKRLAKTVPMASTFEVGETFEKRMLVGLKISINPSKKKTAVWIDGGIHAREWISPATVMYFIKLLLEQHVFSSVLKKFDIYVLPVFNADGYEYTRTGKRNRLWRKTRTSNGPKYPYCVGTDPNRNWDAFWEKQIGTSRNPCSEVYSGTNAESEPCVRMVSRYLDNLKATVGLKSYFNVHAYSQLILTPWSYTLQPPKDDWEIQRVGNIFAANLKKVNGIEYKVGSPPRIIYAVSGGSMDYTYGRLGVVYSYALELRDKGKYGFLLPPKFIEPSGIETTKGFLAAFDAMCGAGTGITCQIPPPPTAYPCVDKASYCSYLAKYPHLWCDRDKRLRITCPKACGTCPK